MEKNLAPVEMENLPLFTVFLKPISGGAGFLPSTVWEMNG